MDCSRLQELFEEKTFKCFSLDMKNKTIHLFNRKNNEMDSHIFEELQFITNTLMKSDCDFYVNDDGSIVLKKEDKDI